MFRMALYIVVSCFLLGLSFAAGLYAGAERTALFTFVKDIKTTIERSLASTTAAEPAPTSSAGHDTLYDPASIALAQANDTPPADLHEWTGFYRIATSEKDLAGHRPLNAWLPPVIAARLQPWALEKMKTTDGVADDTGQICQPTGMFRTTGFSGSFLFLPAADKVVIVYGAINTAGIQRVYLNRTHPRNLPPTWNGDSVGYWEGDTLVVDTIGFNDKSWLHPTMEPHTEEAQLNQRIRRVGDGEFIEVHYTVSDRQALTSAYTYSRYFKRISDEMPEDICNDDLEIWRTFRSEALARQLQRAREVRQP